MKRSCSLIGPQPFFSSNSKLSLSLCGEMNQRKEVVLSAVVSTYYLNKSDNFLYTYLVNLTWTVEGRGFVEMLFCEFCVISNTHNMSLIVVSAAVAVSSWMVQSS